MIMKSPSTELQFLNRVAAAAAKRVCGRKCLEGKHHYDDDDTLTSSHRISALPMSR